VLESATKGDTEALDRLFGPCIPRLQKTAARLLRNPQDAEDALQDGLLSAFRHLHQFEGRAQFMTWMHTIVTNAARSKLRSQRTRPCTFSLDEPVSEQKYTSIADGLVDPRPCQDDEYAHAEYSRILVAILEELPEKLRAIILLCNIEGLPLKDAAVRLGLTVSLVKSRHFRANRLLLKMAKQACTRSKSSGNPRKAVRRPRHPVRRGIGRAEQKEVVKSVRSPQSRARIAVE
jgi:RNA polymerase sigma-70 factor, ECF subfamily